MQYASGILLIASSMAMTPYNLPPANWHRVRSRSPKETIPFGVVFFFSEKDLNHLMEQSGGLFLIPGSTGMTP